ncbi:MULTISPECIES: acyl-CoA thioesterase [Halobacteriovorax]|uniref:acyl-CoA thioesterase n=1 Tax=Halobacteriovorax TaxID=1652133 RepID=UPI000EB6FC7F|nr:MULTISPECIES: hotdog domain-containing protein [Halobacteriovorax]AYF45162.1 thioesterase family protein [Halobacteriovorax sp. BALOs_7]
MTEDQLKDAIARSKTRIVRAVFPNSTNHYDTLFGGITLKWMDEVAFITATRFGRKKFVTVSSDRVDFNMPIPGGHFAELIGEVVKVGKSSLIVDVTLMLEAMYEEGQVEAVKGSFTLVAINDERKAVPIFS